MRVISGTARGHKLTAPGGKNTRPTGDRMKEDLFNILAPEVGGAYFLDLYCGSGAIGIEALSRGADSAVFVDESEDAIAVTKENLAKTRLSDRAEVLLMSDKTAQEKLADRVFDIIFMDPPYNSGITWVDLPCRILVVECPLNAQITGTPYRQKKYAQMQYVFYEISGEVKNSDSNISR